VSLRNKNTAKLAITAFKDQYERNLMACKSKLEQLKENGQRVVVWGAGSKGVTFLNTFNASGIEYAVDLNSSLQDRYVPGTGQLIVSPEFLKRYRPHVVFVMNPIYHSEIEKHARRLGLGAEFIDA
jgi:ABC-type Fe3+-hydroxamate transport system substrate-binding protein